MGLFDWLRRKKKMAPLWATSGARTPEQFWAGFRGELAILPVMQNRFDTFDDSDAGRPLKYPGVPLSVCGAEKVVTLSQQFVQENPGRPMGKIDGFVRLDGETCWMEIHRVGQRDYVVSMNSRLFRYDMLLGKLTGEQRQEQKQEQELELEQKREQTAIGEPPPDRNTRIRELAQALNSSIGNKDKLIDECVSLGRDAVPELMRALNERSGSEGRDIARALGRIGDPSCVPLLLSIFEGKRERHSADQSVVQEATEALGKIGDPRAVPPLLAALKSMDSERYEMREVAQALGNLGEPAALPYLEQLAGYAGDRNHKPYITSHCEPVAREAIRQIRKKNLPPEVFCSERRKELLEMLSADDVALRVDACYECAEIGGTELVAALVRIIEECPDPDLDVRENLFKGTRTAAAWALGCLGDESARSVLVDALKNDGPWGVSREGIPVRQETGTRIHGMSIEQGLRRAKTEFAKSILKQYGLR